MKRVNLVISAPTFGEARAVSTRARAETMTEDGWTVTVLCAGPPDAAGLQAWKDAANGYRVIARHELPGLDLPVWAMRRGQHHAWHIMFALKQLPAELILFQDRGADGFWTTRAKALGSDFQDCTLAVEVHGPTEWTRWRNREFADEVIDEADLIWCERQTLELADRVDCNDAELAGWLAEHGYGRREREGAPVREQADSHPPPVSVCIAFHRHDRYIARVVRAFLDMAVPELQLVIVDDGTPAQERPNLDALETELRLSGHRVERQANAGAAVARNTAARLASHDHLLFFDADNLPFPDLVRALWRGMERTGADSVGAGFAVVRPSDGAPTPADVIRWHLPPGGSLIAGLFDNHLGDTVALIRRQAFEAVGGFSTDVPRPGCEDWRLFLRLLSQGYRHLTHPWPLFYYSEPEIPTKHADEGQKYLIRTGLFSELARMEHGRLVETAQILAAHAHTLRTRGA